MAILKAYGNQSSAVSRVSEGDDVFLRALRDGALVGADWQMAAIFQGLGFTCSAGTLTTPIVGGGSTTVILVDQPDFCVQVPSGTSIMPLRVEIACGTPAIGADANECEILIGVDQDRGTITGGSGTSLPIYNMNTLRPNTSACTGTSITSQISTDPVLDIELFRKCVTGDAGGLSSSQIWGSLYGLYEPEAPPIINGPALFMGFWGGTVATTAFANISWIEFPSTFSTL